jgi:hypothetical protein
MQAFLRQLTSRPLLAPRLVNPHRIPPIPALQCRALAKRTFGVHSLLLPHLRLQLQGQPIAFNHQRWLSTTSRPLLRHYVRPNPRPSHQFLGFLDKIPQNTVFYGIIGLNCLVFGMWFMAIQKYVCLHFFHQFSFILTSISSRNKKETPRPSYGCKPTSQIVGRISSQVDCELYPLLPPCSLNETLP